MPPKPSRPQAPGASSHGRPDRYRPAKLCRLSTLFNQKPSTTLKDRPKCDFCLLFPSCLDPPSPPSLSSLVTTIRPQYPSGWGCRGRSVVAHRVGCRVARGRRVQAVLSRQLIPSLLVYYPVHWPVLAPVSSRRQGSGTVQDRLGAHTLQLGPRRPRHPLCWSPGTKAGGVRRPHLGPYGPKRMGREFGRGGPSCPPYWPPGAKTSRNPSEPAESSISASWSTWTKTRSSKVEPRSGALLMS
jgi:hypothetical protein